MASNSDKRSRQARAEQMRKERERAEKRRRSAITIGIVVVVLILIGAAGYAIKSQVDQNNAPSAAPSHLTDGVGVVYDREAATGKPAPDDPVEVVLYEDFQCPACRAFEAASGQYLQKAVEKGDITIEYRPIAFLDRMSSTNYSTRSLNAAACVLDEKGVKAFHQLHDLLYANQPEEGSAGLPDSQLAQLAGQVGASDADSCIKNGTYKDWTADVTQKASDAGISSTPTVKVDGKSVGEGVPPLKKLKSAIADAAKKQ